MGHNARRFGLLALGLLLFNAAGLWWIGRQALAHEIAGVRIAQVLPARDADASERLTLVFDRPIPAAAAHSTAALVAAPFRLEPPAAGRWEWEDEQRLAFVLDAPLKPGHVYRATPAAGLEQVLGMRLLDGPPLEWATRALALQRATLEDYAEGEATLLLEFNQSVAPRALEAALRITRLDEGQGGLDARVVSPAAAQALRVEVRSAPGTLELTLAAGLLPVGAERGLVKADVRRVLIAHPEQPAVTYASASLARRGHMGTLRLRFNMALDAGQETPRVEVEPAIDDLTVRISARELVLEGALRPRTTYTLRVPASLLLASGGTLGKPFEHVLETSARSRDLWLPSAGVLSPSGHRTLELGVSNVQTVELRALRVHENNLVAHVRGEGARGTSREVLRQTLALDVPPDGLETVALDLRGLLGDARGIHRVEVRDTESRWTHASATVRLTDLALTAKAETDGAFVWVNSIASAVPIDGATVSAWSYNGQLLGRAMTDADGVARLPLQAGHPDGGVFLFSASKDDDLSYVQPERRPWRLDGMTGGRALSAAHDALLYAERDLYRPGEELHVSGLVRDLRGGLAPRKDFELRLVRPDGVEVARASVQADPARQGLFHQDFATRPDAPTGRYRLELFDGAERLAQREVSVEAFVPARIALDVQAAADAVAVDVVARYLFGRPAAGLAASAEVRFEPRAFAHASWSGYSFADAIQPEPRTAPPHAATLDEDGAVRFEPPIPAELESGLWAARLGVTVTESGGRSVSQSATLAIDTAGRHLGLRVSRAPLAVGADAAIEWALVAGDGALAAETPLLLELYRVHRVWDTVDIGGRSTWRSVEQLERVAEHATDAAEGTWSARLAHGGRYRVLARDLALERTTQAALSALADGAQASTAEPDRVELELDGPTPEPGGEVTVRVRSPFPGTLLLTLEGRRVEHHQSMRLSGTEALVRVPVSAHLIGGATLVATVVRPLEFGARDWRPHRARGALRIETDHGSLRAPLALEVPADARPGARVTVVARTTPPAAGAQPARVHLWAVDVGVLLAGRYTPPAPFEHVYGPRASATSTVDVYGDLLPDHARPATMRRIGGDADGREGLRRRPAPTRDAGALVVWRAARPVAPDGSVSFDIELPERRGALRWMAIVADGPALGAARAESLLTTPILLEASGPRVLAPGDVCRVPLALIDGTGAGAELGVSLAAEGPLRVTFEEPMATLDPGGRAERWARVEALEGEGPAQLAWRVTGTLADGTPVDERVAVELLVRRAVPLASELELVRVEAGETWRCEPRDGFRPEGLLVRARVSGTPDLELQPALDALRRYPHGCLEQTTSRVLALLADPRAQERSAQMVYAGIERLRTMQTADGGLAYWPGRRESHAWGSAYAARALARARLAGFEPDAALVGPLLGYLEEQLGREADPNTLAELLHTCAVLARPARGRMARLAEQADALDLGGRARLARAFLCVGEEERAAALLGDELLARAAVQRTDRGRFTSQTVQEAELLEALLDLDPLHPRAALLAQRIESARTAGAWLSTRENAAALGALARFAALAASEPGAGRLLVGSDEPRPVTAAQPLEWSSAEAPALLVVESSGAGPLYVSLEREGFPLAGAPEPFDSGLSVRRRWLDADGRPLDGPPAVGDLVFVEVVLQAERALANVAVVDALPGGLEVENPRLATSAGTLRPRRTPRAVPVRAPAGSETPSRVPDEVQAGRADRVEFLDDRVLLFTSVGREPRAYRYALRAVTTGTFNVPRIQASSMYDPAFASLAGDDTPLEVVR